MGERHLIGRIVVFSVNFALWGSGIMLIVFGSIGVSNDEAAINMLTGVSSGVDNVVNIIDVIPYMQGVGIFMIVLGCFLFLLGGNGCHGIMRKSKKSTMMYFIWLLGAILVELALIIYAGVYPTTTTSSIEDKLTMSLNKTFENVRVNQTTGEIIYADSTVNDKTTLSWQRMEFDSKCCAARGKQDYYGESRINLSWNYSTPGLAAIYQSAQVPLTCCTVKSKVGVPTNIEQIANLAECMRAAGPAENSYSKDGCGKKVNDLVYQFNLIAIIISSCLIGAEIVGVIFAARIWKDTD